MPFRKVIFSLFAFLLLSPAWGGGILNFGNGGEPKDIDPQKASGDGETRIIQNVFAGLVSKDPKTLEVIPDLAEKWTESSDHKKFTFFLRKNAKWSNGEPITAKDVIYSWTRFLDPKTLAETATLGHVFKNGKEFNQGKITDVAKLGFRAKGDYTVEVELAHPAPYFLKMIYYNPFRVVHQKTIEKFSDRWTYVENIVVSGPFIPKLWETNLVVRTVKNSQYWDAANVSLDGVNFWSIENLSTEESMFRSGQLHVTLSIPPEKVPTWKKDKTGAFQCPVSLATYVYQLNVRKPPLNDVRVRKALALTVDRKLIVDHVTLAGQKPAETWSPPGIGGYHPTPRLNKTVTADDVKNARQLLAEAGYPDGKKFPDLEVLYNTAESHKKIGEAVQAMWKKHLGINLKLVNQEWKVYLDAIHSGNFQVARFTWGADYPDASTFLEYFLSDNPSNETGWKSAEYDKLVHEAARESNPKARLQLFDRAEGILLAELPLIPFYTYVHPFLMSPKVEGLYPNLEDVWMLKNVKLKS